MASRRNPPMLVPNLTRYSSARASAASISAILWLAPLRSFSSRLSSSALADAEAVGADADADADADVDVDAEAGAVAGDDPSGFSRPGAEAIDSARVRLARFVFRSENPLEACSATAGYSFRAVS